MLLTPQWEFLHASSGSLQFLMDHITINNKLSINSTQMKQ